MNERIEELAEQAGFESGHQDRNGNSLSGELEKFAELIIRECVDICNRVYFENYPDAEDFERSQEGDAIQNHFGVDQEET